MDGTGLMPLARDELLDEGITDGMMPIAVWQPAPTLFSKNIVDADGV